MILVHAVGPFDSDEESPPRNLVRTLADRGLSDVIADLPSTCRDTLEEVPRLIADHRPSAWIGIGYASNRMSLSLEAIAVNLRSWAADDEQPNGPGDDTQARVANGPAAYMTSVPVDEVLAAWGRSGVPGYLSLKASGSTCNLSYYAAAHTVSELGLNCQVGFLNVPRSPEMLTEPKAQASVPRDLQFQGLVDLVSSVRDCKSSVGPYLRSAL